MPPRQLDLSPEVKASLVSYLTTELQNHRAERGDLVDRWKRENLDFWAEPSTAAQSSLPVIGFASLIVPVTAIAAEAIHARVMGSHFGMDDLVTTRIADTFSKHKAASDDYFNYIFRSELEYRKKMESPFFQTIINGTGFVQVGYRDTKTSVLITKADGSEVKVPISKEKGTCVEGVDIEDFLMPFYATCTDTSPWVGHQFRVSEYSFKQMVAGGETDPESYAALESYFRGTTQGEDKLTQTRDITDTTPVFPAEIKLTRLLLDFVVDETDEDSPSEESRIEVLFHEDGNILVSCIYAEEERDYEKGIYMALPYRWYGYGVAKQNISFQEEITAIHRQRLDNATIANMAMFKVKRTATWIKDDEPIFPGKKWFVNEMNDIEPMFIGDVKASAYNNENQVYIYSQQRTGVNELTLGMPNVGTPGTASDSLARVQESARKFDYINSNLRDFANRVIYKAAKSVIKNGPRFEDAFDYITGGLELRTFLQSDEILKSKLIFDIEAVSARQNRVLDRNTYTQLVGIQTQYWTSMITLIEQMGDPAMAQAAKEKAISSADLLNLEILNAFDIPDPKRFILDFDAIRTKISQGTPPAPTTPPVESLGPAGGSSITSVLAPNARIEASGSAPNFNFPSGGLPLAG